VLTSQIYEPAHKTYVEYYRRFSVLAADWEIPQSSPAFLFFNTMFLCIFTIYAYNELLLFLHWHDGTLEQLNFIFIPTVSHQCSCELYL